jgi:hypothetical protein
VGFGGTKKTGYARDSFCDIDQQIQSRATSMAQISSSR